MTLNRVNFSFVGEAKGGQTRVYANILYMILLPSGLGSFSQLPETQDTCSHFSDSAVVMNIFQRLPTLACQCPTEVQLGYILRLECYLRVSSIPVQCWCLDTSFLRTKGPRATGSWVEATGHSYCSAF